jgi:hypothetical protein
LEKAFKDSLGESDDRHRYLRIYGVTVRRIAGWYDQGTEPVFRVAFVFFGRCGRVRTRVRSLKK